MADKIVVMQAGHVEQIGAPLDVYDRPANTFVAGFIGSPAMNTLDAVVGAGGRTARLGDVDFDILPGPGLEEGRPIRLGVRPEHLVQAEAGLTAEVSVIEPTGSETHVVLRHDGADMVMLLKDRREFSVGQNLRVAAAPEHLHIFDRDGGQRIN